MKQFISFIIKETRHILRDKRTMLILFGMPVVMMLLFGFAISTDVKNVRTVVVLSSVDHETQKKVEALGASEYFNILYKVNTPAEAEQLIRRQKADIAIVFGLDFASRHSGIQLITDGADPNMAQMYSNYAMQILSSSSTHHSSLSNKLLYNPQMRSCYNFVPGIIGMLLMLICAMMTSISIVREKERGTMEVLLVSPVRPLMIIIAKAVPYLILAFIILSAILLISKYILLVPLTGSLFWIVAVSGIYIIVALSLGLLISTVAKTQLVALLASAMMLIMPCVLLSGMMFPVESMPEILQYVASILPPRYYIAAIRKLMIMGVGIDKVAHEVLVLCIMAFVLLSAALLKFNKRL
ncbi:MAG: ABC transporter permease [Prevotella sp.]|uniref:ABC transporter permease n=1 Tax=Segatella copri TaxID=165179 RepID=UPI003F89D3BE|nr:ABC transporter permease [Prevotella sp.]